MAEQPTTAFPLPGFEDNGRHMRNGHTLSLDECDWRCEQCGHFFDAASDADRFACGQDCTGKHPGDETPEQRLLRAIFEGDDGD